jgi:pimeloyl-ACP methyl ester carboxylesterase
MELSHLSSPRFMGSASNGSILSADKADRPNTARQANGDRVSRSLKPKSSASEDALPAELKNIKPTRLQRAIAGQIARLIKNPRPKSLPAQLMRERLPHLKTVQFESIDVKSSNPKEHFKLNGYWSPAQNKNSNTCIVLVHGFSGSPRDFFTLAHRLNTNGYNVFMPELRAHGKRGKHRESTIGVLEGRDIVGALKHLDTDPAYQGKVDNIHMIGHSMGAASLMTLPGVIPQEDLAYVRKRVRTVILDSPYENRAATIQLRAKKVYNHPLVRALRIQKFVQGICKAFIETMNEQAATEKFPGNDPNVRPAEIMNRYPAWRNKIKLHIHGDQDHETPLEDGRKIDRTFKEAGAEHPFVLLPDTDHVGREYLTPRKWWPFKSAVVLRGSVEQKQAYIKRIKDIIDSNGEN